MGLDVLDLNGCRLRLRRIAGPAAGPTLVFLHEGLGSITQWRDVPDALAEATGCRALIYERQGYGGSSPRPLPWPDDFLEREADRVLPAVLDLEAVERPILIGHSDGGSIALLFAAAFPGRPLGVVTEAAHVVLDGVTRAGLAGVAEAWQRSELRHGLERHHGQNTADLFQGWLDSWQGPARATWDITGRLPRIACPLLAIQGADDEHGEVAQLDAITGGVSGPAERFLVPGCGHVPHHQARGPVLARIAAFVKGLAAPAAEEAAAARQAAARGDGRSSTTS